MALVALTGATVELGGRLALGPLDLEIGAGDVWGVVGPNGAGKTTLLLAIVGLRPVSSGRVEVLGATVRQAHANREVGLLLQEHAYPLDVPFTVSDVVALGRVGRGGGAESRRAVACALEELELGPLTGRLYRELSGGQRRKVQLARLLAQEARILLLDEPGAGLDPDWQARLGEILDGLAARHGLTIVMVTHRVEELPASCSHALLLREGRALAAGRASDVLRATLLSRLYGCTMAVESRGGRVASWAVSG